MPPGVSVVLPTYNRAQTLGRAVESVLSQTFGDLELVVVDDGSTDETGAVLLAYAGDRRVRIIREARNAGCAAARNLGLSASAGRYVAFQDSDDEWRPDRLKKAVAALDKLPPEFGVFYSDMLRVEGDGGSHYLASPAVRRGVFIDPQTLDYTVHGVGIQTALIRRECFDRVGLFDVALPRLIDLDLFIRLSDHFDFFHQREPLVNYYATGGISADMNALAEARRHLIGKYYRRLRERKEHLAYQYVLLAWALGETGRRAETYRYALESLLLAPREPKVRETALQLITDLLRKSGT